MKASESPDDQLEVEKNRTFRASLTEVELAAYEKMIETQAQKFYAQDKESERARPLDVYRRSAERAVRNNWEAFKDEALKAVGIGKAVGR